MSTNDSAKKSIDISDTDYDINGIDCIWHNMDCRSDFGVFRRWYYCSMGDILVLIGDRVRHKVFDVLSLNATKHMVVITIATQRGLREMVDKWVNEDYWIAEDSVDDAPVGQSTPPECGEQKS